MVAKPSISEFFKTELLFLRHIITATRIKPYSAKVEAIAKMPPQKDSSRELTFLDMIAYVLKFIPKGGELIAPLMKSLTLNARFPRPSHKTPLFRHSRPP